MEDHNKVSPTPSGTPSPQEQEIVLNLNHGTAPVTPPPSTNPTHTDSPTTAPYNQQLMPIGDQQPYPQTVPNQPAAQWQGGPLPQAPYPTNITPPTTPPDAISPQPPTNDKAGHHSKKLLLIVALVVIAVVLIGGSAAAVLLSGKKPTKANTGNTASQSCADPTTGSTVNKADAEVTFIRVAQAVKEKNQRCVTSLSSAYFTRLQALTYPDSNGQWITKSEDNLPSLAARLANLQSSFSVSQFTSSSYTRAATTDSAGEPVDPTNSPPEGLTLSYSITDAYTKTKVYLEISFISSNGKVVVDYLKLVPTPINTNSSSTTPTQTPASPDAGAVAADHELAQQDVASIQAYLSTYRSDTRSYPNTLDSTTFIDAGIGVDTNVFSPPAGTSFVYTPTPSTCTTAAKNCTAYTLTAMDTSSNSTIYGVSGSTTSGN
jgi:hypothetical protein